MIYIQGLAANLRTLTMLSAAATGPGELDDLSGVKRAYQRFLDHSQPRIPHPDTQSWVFVDSGPLLRTLVGEFNVESHLDDTPYELTVEESSAQGREVRAQLGRTLQHINERNPELGAAFDLAINTVFVAPCRIAGGGTTSSAIGVLWLDPRASWGNVDWVEIILHELTHTYLFLDEYRHGHYASREMITDRAVTAVSAIRGDMRPLDKVFHSIVVATEVLLAREAAFGHPEHPVVHPPTGALTGKVSASIGSLRSVPDLDTRLRPRALDLLDRCDNLVAELGSGTTATSLSRA